MSIFFVSINHSFLQSKTKTTGKRYRFVLLASFLGGILFFPLNVKADLFETGGLRYAEEYLCILEENEPDLISSGSGPEESDDNDQAEDPASTQFIDDNGRLIHTIVSPVALVDICGDPTPELVFITKQIQSDSALGSDELTGPVLHVYTYNGFSCEEVLRQILETNGGFASWCLFQTSGEKNLWVYTSTGYSQKKCTYTNYSLKQGAFQIDQYLLRNPPQGDSLPVCLDSDVQISEETWLAEETEMTDTITSIIQWNSIESENAGLMDKVSSLYQGANSLEGVKETLKKLL